MKVGIFCVSTSDAPPIGQIAEWAEARGFESIWVPEHTHIPVKTEAPADYARLLDPFVALTAAAVATRELRLGTGVCLVIERDTILTAKTVASLDHVSNGRVLFGVGAGWNRAEMENHGTGYDSRFEKMCDQLEALKTIWHDEQAEHHGPHVDFDAIYSWPKPVQSPHPPVLIGGESSHTLRRIVQHADGWLPRCTDLDRVIEGMQELRGLADEAERSLPVSVFGVPPDPNTLKALEDGGAERAILVLRAMSDNEARARLDSLAKLLDR